MVEVVPTINVKTFAEVKDRVKIIEPLGLTWAQLDVSDGVFTDFVSFNSPEELRELKTHLKLEVHLMTYEPEHDLDRWISSGVRRIIFHYEATHKGERIINEITRAGLEAGVALRPLTPWQFAEKLFSRLDLVQILGVNPGPSGQEFFGEEVVRKIETLKKAYPDMTVEVDGGVNDKTAKMLVDAGADILAVGSYLFSGDNPKEALERLRAQISNS